MESLKLAGNDLAKATPLQKNKLCGTYENTKMFFLFLLRGLLFLTEEKRPKIPAQPSPVPHVGPTP